MNIAIVIPAYNVAPFLRVCVQSVLAQTHRDWRAVIVDDGSDDAVSAVMAEFQDNRISLIRQPNGGVSAARNRGISAVANTGRTVGQKPLHASADAVLFLDGDDWLAPDALSRLAEALDDAPWAAAACGRYARVALNGSAHLSAASPRGDLLERLLTRNLFANGGHVLIRREVVEVAGDFCADLTYGEDWEYWTRVALCGEFMPVASVAPILYVRERPGSAYLSRATDPASYRPALDRIYGNPAIGARLVGSRLVALRRCAQAEIAWSIGRELIRHGRTVDGRRWLYRSIRDVPNMKRLLLTGVARLRFGPFRPYGTTG